MGGRVWGVARLAALRGCGRRVCNYPFWHAFGVETPRADVSTCQRCDCGLARLAAFGGWGRRVCNGRFWHAFGVETPRADVST